mmetsp:Transcript_14117/g.30690  ORF Transcript_14117/g.30690 Transcript_14117/m.30690 type:complete len:206 (-) Transcript_14117:1121-1738(-)
MPHLLLRPAGVPDPGEVSLLRLSRVHRQRDQGLSVHIHPRELHRVQPAHPPAGQVRHPPGRVPVLRQLPQRRRRAGSNLRRLLRRRPDGRDTERHPPLQPAPHVLLRRARRGGEAGVEVLRGSVLQGAERRERALRSAERLLLLRAVRSGGMSAVPVSLRGEENNLRRGCGDGGENHEQGEGRREDTAAGDGAVTGRPGRFTPRE